MKSLENMVKRYIITGAQYGAAPNTRFVQSMETYARENDAEIIVVPLAGPYKDDNQLDQRFERFKVVHGVDYDLNRNLRISDIQVPPTAVDPISGVKRFAQGDSSFIIASPKQRLEYVSVPAGRISKAALTTGAATKPNYKLHTKVGRVANADHQYGAVIVEIDGPSFFHFRHVKANAGGSFTDLGVRYGPKGTRKAKTVALIPGDIHPYDTDPKHEKNTFDQIEFFKPANIFLHDTFNATSISHHYDGKNIERFQVFKSQGLDLEKELERTAEAVTRYATKVGKHGTVYVVASNHDEHLTRYLDEGRFVNDKGNDLVGAKLYVAALQGEYPLEYALRNLSSDGVPSNVQFLSRDDDLRLKGFQLANHGDLGANGGRGSLASTEIANGKSITGHSHSAAILRDTYRVGTSTRLKLRYNRGYSNWSQTNAVLYDDGTVQLLNSINGKWRSK